MLFRHIEERDQTEAICVAVVQQNGYVLKWVKNQTEVVCMAAVKSNVVSFCYIKDPAMKLELDNMWRGYRLDL